MRHVPRLQIQRISAALQIAYTLLACKGYGCKHPGPKAYPSRFAADCLHGPFRGGRGACSLECALLDMLDPRKTPLLNHHHGKPLGTTLATPAHTPLLLPQGMRGLSNPSTSWPPNCYWGFRRVDTPPLSLSLCFSKAQGSGQGFQPLRQRPLKNSTSAAPDKS